MQESISSVLAEGKALFRKIAAETSTDLADVKDLSSGIMVRPWRASDRPIDHPLHRMMSRVGGFPPGLARYFIAAYSRRGEVVMDPFCGKGTALLEALVAGRLAVGGDLAPDAVIASRAKCAPVSVAELAGYLQRLPLGRNERISEVPPDVALFFSRRTLQQLMSVRRRIRADMEEGPLRRVATFACGVLLGILHGHSRLSLSVPCNQAFGMAPNYVRRYIAVHKLERPERDVRDCLLQRSLELLPAPRLLERSRVQEMAAQNCERSAVGAFSSPALVLTSPPYLARQTYVKDSWLRLWLLGRDRSSLLPGSMETGNILTFLAGATESLEAMVKVLKPRGRIVLVCGRANVEIARQRRPVRVADLCLFAIENTATLKRSLRVERLIIDRKRMLRGSYFAVHGGRTVGVGGVSTLRYGEDEILVLQKRR